MELSDAEDYEFIEQEIEPFSFSTSPQQHRASVISQPPDVELQADNSMKNSQLSQSNDHRSFPDYSSLSSQHAESFASPLAQGEAPKAGHNLIPAQNAFSDIKLLQISPLPRQAPEAHSANATAAGTRYFSPQVLSPSFQSSSSQNASYRLIGSPATGNGGSTLYHTDAAQQSVASPSILIPEQLAPRADTYALYAAVPTAYPYNSAASPYGSQREASPEEYVSDALPERRERADLAFSVFPLLQINQSDRLQPDEEFDSFAALCVDWERFASAAKGARLASEPPLSKARNFIVNGVIVKGFSGDSLVDPRNQLVAPYKGFY